MSCNKSQKSPVNPLSPEDDSKYDSLKKIILAHYEEKDSLAKNSANYLLENLKYHYTLDGSRITAFTEAINKYSSDQQRLAEEIDRLNYSDVELNQVKQDVSNIPATYIISNIDKALKTYRNNPWKKDIPFDKFSNYVLPYRIGLEPISDWRSYFSRHFFSENDSTIFKKDIRSALVYIHQWYYNQKKTFKLKFGSNNLQYPDLPPPLLDKIDIGSCHELTFIGISALRSLGIPATIDFTPMYVNLNNGHEWCGVALNTESFSFDISAPIINHKDPYYKLSKVYRKSFSPVSGNHFYERGHIDYLPPFLNDPFLLDVTSSYRATSSISLPITIPASEDPEYCYLSVFTPSGWTVVDWGKIKSSECNFNNVGRDGIYMPVYFKDGQSIPLSEPVLLRKDGTIKPILSDMTHLEKVKLDRKYPMKALKVMYLNRMPGGKFQGSNFSDFRDAETLYEIKTNPGEHFNVINLNNQKKYRFLRYLSPKDGHGNIAEVEFYENDNEPLKGKVIGTEGSLLNNPECTKEAAFDGKLLTYFDTEQPDNVWTGMDLGSKKNISKIRFIARTDLNAIQEDNSYELLYWNNGWQSLGEQIADTKPYLIYDKVPKNALLWLRNHTGGIEERIFTYENGKQVWW